MNGLKQSSRAQQAASNSYKQSHVSIELHTKSRINEMQRGIDANQRHFELISLSNPLKILHMT